MSKLNIVTAGLLLAAMAAPAAAVESVFTAALNGQSEAPPNDSQGTGTAKVTIDFTPLVPGQYLAASMHVEEAFSGLSAGNTASHIHCCTTVPGTGTAGVATTVPTFTDFPAGTTSSTYDHTFNMLDASSYNSAFITANGGNVQSAFNAFLIGMNAGATYTNIHTGNFPMGEIRGFLAPIPEPETYAMFLAGIGLLGALARRRHG